MRITTHISRGLVGNTAIFLPTYSQLVGATSSSTQVTPTCTPPSPRLTQDIHLKKAFTRTPIKTFAHFHSPNNKE